jgi:hypothetical protein
LEDPHPENRIARIKTKETVFFILQVLISAAKDKKILQKRNIPGIYLKLRGKLNCKIQPH